MKQHDSMKTVELGTNQDNYTDSIITHEKNTRFLSAAFWLIAGFEIYFVHGEETI